MCRNNITNTIKTKTKTRDMGIFFGHTVHPNRSLLTTRRDCHSQHQISPQNITLELIIQVTRTKEMIIN